MADEPRGEQPIQLREYLSVLRRRRWTIVLVSGIAVFGALAVSLRMTAQYSATAKVLVKPLMGNQQLPQPVPGSSALSLDTESQIVGSAAVATIAGKTMDSSLTSSELLKHVSVSVPADTQILEITYSDPSPLVAQQGAQAFADASLTFKRDEALATYDSLQSSIQTQINDLETQLNRARHRFTHARPASQARSAAANKISLLSSQIALLRNQITGINTLDIDPGAVIEPASVPASPSGPNHVLNGGLGLFVGLALGLGLAFLRERLDDRLRGRADLEEHIAAPTFVAIPKLGEWKDRNKAILVTIEDPKSAATEAYKTLRTSILFAAAQSGLKTLMVASAVGGEGKTTTAANLASVLAQTGKRVILVSADLRKPRARKFFQNDGVSLDAERGVSTVLTGSTSWEEALQPTSIDGLWLMDAGPVPANPAEMAQSAAMATLLEALRDAADFTVIDTAPALFVTDALAIAPHVDAILYVADAGITTRQTVSRARVQLEHVGGRILGAVLNSFDPSRAGYPGYEYGYRASRSDRRAWRIEGRLMDLRQRLFSGRDRMRRAAGGEYPERSLAVQPASQGDASQAEPDHDPKAELPEQDEGPTGPGTPSRQLPAATSSSRSQPDADGAGRFLPRNGEAGRTSSSAARELSPPELQ